MSRDPFRNLNQYKIDPLSEIRNAGIITNGDVYWVSSSSDSKHRDRTDLLGRGVVKTSLQAGIDAAKNDNNDYVLVIPTDSGTVRSLSEGVNVNKRRVHILGVGNKPTPMGYDGLTFEGFATTSTVDTELVNITSAGVEIGGLKFLGTSGTSANGTITAYMRIGTASTGTPHDLWIHDVHVENTQAAAAGGTAPLVSISGNVAGGIKGITIEDSWIGNWNWAPSAVLVTAGTAGPTRMTLKRNTFVIDAQATTDDFIVLGTGATEFTLLEGNRYINVEAGTAPASAITGALLVDNPVFSVDERAINVTAIGTDTELLVSPIQAGTAGAGMHNPGIGIVGTAPIPAA